MSIFRTFLPQRCRTFFHTLQNQISRSFSERGLLELGMLEGICTTLENKAQQERIRALYPASGLFGAFADADTATAMQQKPVAPYALTAALAPDNTASGTVQEHLRVLPGYKVCRLHGFRWQVLA